MNSNFEKIYKESIKNPEEFWKKIADDVYEKIMDIIKTNIN